MIGTILSTGTTAVNKIFAYVDLTVSGGRQIFWKIYMSGGGKGKVDRKWLAGMSSGAVLCRVVEKVLSYKAIFEQRSEGSKRARHEFGEKECSRHRESPKTRVYFGMFPKQQRGQLSRMEGTKWGRVKEDKGQDLVRVKSHRACTPW